AIEEQRAPREARQGGDRGLVRLVGGDEGEHRSGAFYRLGRGRSAEHVRRRIVGSLRRAHLRVRRIGLDVVSANTRPELRVRAPAVEKGARRLAEAEKRDGAYR